MLMLCRGLFTTVWQSGRPFRFKVDRRGTLESHEHKHVRASHVSVTLIKVDAQVNLSYCTEQLAKSSGLCSSAYSRASNCVASLQLIITELHVDENK